MLDDLKYIHQRDKSDALGLAEKQPSQLLHTFTITPEFKPDHVYNVVFAGMGGSALAALLATSWPEIKEPFEVIRGYDIPAYVDGDTLFIASSYSGNTEEELSTLEQAKAKGAQIVVMASGGKLAEIATAKNYPFVEVPKASQPRYAVFYAYRALLTILEAAGVIDKLDDQIFIQAAKFLEAELKNWLPVVPKAQNPAKQLAFELLGLSPVIYAGPILAPAAYKWKISCNENAKNVAWWDQYPEFDHNEFIGWSGKPIHKPYAVIDLISPLDNPRIKKRFELSAKLLSGKRPAPNTVTAKGDNVLQQLLWTVLFGDFVTLYLALLNNVDPSPVDLVERLKKELAS